MAVQMYWKPDLAEAPSNWVESSLEGEPAAAPQAQMQKQCSYPRQNGGTKPVEHSTHPTLLDYIWDALLETMHASQCAYH